MKLTFLIIFICLTSGLNAQWKHITRLPGTYGGVERQICIAPDYCLAYNYTDIMYLSTNQGQTWDSVYKFTNRYFETFYSTPDCQYYFFNRDDFSSIPGSKKVILKINNDFKKIEIINHIDTSSYIYTFGNPFMFDLNNGIIWSQENIKDGDNNLVDNNNKFFLVTHNGWKTLY